MSYGDGLYHSPKLADLEIIEEENKGGGYDFDMLVVWRHIPTGDLYWATDSGCSCPSPFESYTSLADLTRVARGGGWEAFEKVCKEYGLEVKLEWAP